MALTSSGGRVWITGGGGFVGGVLRRLLPEAIAPTSRELDLRVAEDVGEFVAQEKPTLVVHLAARVGGIVANLAEPADFLLDNMRMDANVLAALRQHPPEHLVVMLSTCMYPDRLDDSAYPMSEDCIEAGPPPPSNAAYASAKRALWHGARALHQQHGIPFTALVPANVYGPGDHFGQESSHFLAAAIDRIERARLRRSPRVEFFGTGVALRQYVLVDDLAWLTAHVLALGPLNTTVNVAPQDNRSVRELCRLVAESADYDGDVVFTGEGPDGQLRKDVSVARLRELMPDWERMETPLPEGLRRTIDWYRTHVETG